VTGWRVATSGRVTKRPPSRGQVLSAGSSDSRGGCCTVSQTGPEPSRFIPTFASARNRSRSFHSLPIVGGISSSGSFAARRMSSLGLDPNASSTRRADPKRFVTSGNFAPRGLRKRIAGPFAAMTRRWTSATSRSGSTSASISISSPSRLSTSRNARKSRGAGEGWRTRIRDDRVAECGADAAMLPEHDDIACAESLLLVE